MPKPAPPAAKRARAQAQAKRREKHAASSDSDDSILEDAQAVDGTPRFSKARPKNRSVVTTSQQKSRSRQSRDSEFHTGSPISTSNYRNPTSSPDIMGKGSANVAELKRQNDILQAQLELLKEHNTNFPQPVQEPPPVAQVSASQSSQSMDAGEDQWSNDSTTVLYKSSSAMRTLIKQKVEFCYRTTKFLKDEVDRDRLCEKIMDMIDHRWLRNEAGESSNAANKVKECRTTFVVTYGKFVAQAINAKRNYSQSQLKDVILAEMRKIHEATAGSLIFTVEELEMLVTTRDPTIFGDDEANMAKYRDILDFYTESMVPAVAGCTLYSPNTRHHHPMSSVTIANTNLLKIPAATEALTVLFYRNAFTKWSTMHKWRVIDNTNERFPRWKKKEPNNNLDFKTKYSDDSSGKSEFGGWSIAGKKEFVRLGKLIKTNRKDNEARVLAQDTLCMGRIRAKHGTAQIGNARPPAPADTDESDFEFDLDD